MLLRCLVLLFCLTAICAQKGGRQASSSSPSNRLWAGRKLPQASEIVQQEEDREPEEALNDVVVAPPRRPQPIEDPGHPAPEPYSFSYSVDDSESGAATSREETQDINGEIVGFYHMQDAEGRMRRVDYTAGKDGFKASIRSNEEGLDSKDPADVRIELGPLTPNAYPTNNRPVVSVVPVQPQNYGRLPSSARYYQNLSPAPIAPLPVAPAPLSAPSTPVETRRIQNVVEQKAEDPADEAQLSQTYETSDPRQIVQQRNVDEEEAFESAPPPPVKGGSTVLPATQIWNAPPQGPTQIWNAPPQRLTQVWNPLPQGPAQVWNAPPQRPAQVWNAPPQRLTQVWNPLRERPAQVWNAPQVSYNDLRPLSPIVTARPIPSVTPTLVQYNQRVQTIQESVPNLQPLNPLSNQIVLQQSEHREPIIQQRLLNYLQPSISIPQPIPQVLIAPQAPEPLRTSFYAPPLTPRPFPQANLPLVSYQYRPLPSPPQSIQRVDQPLFEPQTYEPIQQTYEPLQQEAEDPAEESRSEPPCSDCVQTSETIPQPIKGYPSAPSEPQPIKSGRLSPARAFIPQAFRS